MRNLTCLWCKGDQAGSVSQRWREDSPNSSSHSSSKTMMPFSKDLDSGFSVPLGSGCTSASEKDLHRSASFRANSARKLTWLTSGLSRPCFAWHGCFDMRKPWQYTSIYKSTPEECGPVAWRRIWKPVWCLLSGASGWEDLFAALHCRYMPIQTCWYHRGWRLGKGVSRCI